MLSLVILFNDRIFTQGSYIKEVSPPEILDRVQFWVTRVTSALTPLT